MMINYKLLGRRCYAMLKNDVGNNVGGPSSVPCKSIAKSGLFKMFLWMCLMVSAASFGQITLISPTGDGGFETGNTFALNSWNVAQGALTARVWQIGTGQAGYTGNRAAFIGNSATNVGANGAARVVHLYKSITVPAGATNLALSFKYKQAVSDFAGGTYYDYIRVSVGAVPVNGTDPAGTIFFGPYPSANVTSFTNQTATLPNSIAGTTTNLIFTFNSDDVTPNGYGAIDDVSLTYTLPTCGAPASLAVTPAPPTGANFSWTSSIGTPISYQWEVRSSGAAGSGSTGLVDSGTTSGTTASTSLLTGGSSYTFYVRSNCGSEFSAWSSSAFAMPLVSPTPYNEGFATTALPTGWAATNFAVGVPFEGLAGNPGNTMFLNLYGLVPNGNFSTINIGQVQANQVFSFDYALANYASPYAPPSATSGSFVVAISTNYGTSYTTLATIANDAVAGYRTRSFPLTSYVGQNIKIRITATRTSGDYNLAFDNFKVSATCTGTPTGGTASPVSQSVCSGGPTTAITVTGASADAGVNYQWEQSIDGGANWGNAVGGTGATTTSYAPPVYGGTVIKYRLKATCTGSGLFAYSTISEINSNPRPLPLNETFTSLATLTGWSQSGGFGVGTARGATGNPGNNAFVNMYSLNTAATFSTAQFGPITGGMIFSFDLKLSNFASPYDPPAAGWGSLNVMVSTNCGTSFSTVGTINSAPAAGYVNYKYYLGDYVGSNIIVRVSGSWGAGDYDISVDNFKIEQTAPVISSFTPTSGCNSANASVNITGFGFTGTTAVKFNNVNATSFVVNSDTSISAVIANPTTGLIEITNAIGFGTSATPFTGNSSPTVADITAPDGATNVCFDTTLILSDATPTGVWSSSDVDKATINTSGVVTPVSVGNVVISYTVTDGLTGCASVKTYPLSISEPVQITSSTPTQTVVTGGDTSFAVVATGTGNPALTYQWEVCTDGTGENFSPVVDDANYAGSNSATLSVNDAPVEFNGYFYQCTITGVCNAIISDLAVLLVGETGIDTQPSNATVCSSGSGEAIFTIVASEDVTGYQWQEDQGGDNWVNLSEAGMYSGVNTASLMLTGVTVANSGWRYRCQVTGIGFAESNPATLTVIQAPSIDANPVAQTICYSGGTSIFTAAASGGFTAYQWQYSSDNGTSWNNVTTGTPTGASYSGAASGSLSVTTTAATPSAGTHLYRALAIAGAPCGNAISGSAQLIINNPSISAQPAATSVLVGNTATFNVTASTLLATGYQWQYGVSATGPWNNVANNTPAGVTYTGTTASSLSAQAGATATGGNANYYRAVISSGAGCSVNSSAAQLTINGYCQPPATALTTTGDVTDNIVNVVITNNTQSTNVTQASAGSAPWFTLYNNTPLNVMQGNSMTVAMTFSSDTNQFSAVWIDYNRNGTFETSETVGLAAATAGANGTATYNFTIPFTATPGVTRIRFRGGSDSAYLNSNACTPIAYGETEDYLLNIVLAPACSGTPTPATITTSVVNICGSGSAVLTASYDTSITGTGLQWYNSAGAIASATGATYTTPVLSASQTYYARITCANGGGFADSNPITLNISNPSVAGTTPGTRCGTGTVSLQATASAGSNLTWYGVTTGGVPLGTGSPFITPIISANTNYYVAAENITTGVATIGTATTRTTATEQPTAFCNRWASYKGQYLFTAAELLSAGLRAGNITSVSFNISTQGDAATNANYRVAMKTTTATAMSDFVTGLTNVYGPATYTHAVGVNTVNFATPFNWDGTSNVIVEVTHDGADSANNSRTFFTATTANTVAWAIDGDAAATLSTSRLNMGFGGQIPCASTRSLVVATVNTPPVLTISGAAATICSGNSTPLSITSNVNSFDVYSWSPATGVAGTAATGYSFSPASTTTYTLTASQTGGSQCANTATFTVTVNPTPGAVVLSPASTTTCLGDIVALSSTGASMGTGAYCTPVIVGFPGAGGDYINNFTFGNITNNASGDAASDYTYYSALTANVVANGSTTYPISLQAGGASSTYEQNFRIWIDFNQNGVFEASESVFNTTTATFNNTTVNGTATVPPTAYNGITRMRVASRYSSVVAATEACQIGTASTSAWGEFEDYNVNITGGVIPPAPVVWSPTTGLYTDAAATVAYTGTSAATVYAKPLTTTSYTATRTSGAGCPSAVSNTATVTVNQFYPFFADTDGDHYGTGTAVQLCSVNATTPPAGYAVAGGDCNDNVAAINPGVADIPYNGVDDNCNGTIDETGTITTTLLPSSCGTTLASIGSIVGITTINGHPITGYRIRVTNGAQVQVIETNVPHFTFPQFPQYAYATTYTVEIQLQRAGIWQANYGTACFVSTPAILEEGGAGSVNPSQCGITLNQINTLIATTSLAGVTGYRFRVTNLTDTVGPNAVQTLDRTQNWFSLQMLTRYNYGTTYQIEVSVKTTGTYGGFGSPCQVSSPAAPSLTNCGGTVALKTTAVGCNSLAGVTQYRFQVTRQSDNASATIDRSVNWFNFNMVPSAAYTIGAMYTVRVAVMTAGTWSPFGDACEIQAPSGTGKGIAAATTATASAGFKAMAYPNPFTADFQLDVTSSSQENVQLKVYDMLGKLVESREVKVSDLNMEKVGAQYPSGVYNVIVSQDGIVKTLRVIKR
jgi:hypothetical protein